MSSQNPNNLDDEISEIYSSYLGVVQPLLIDAQIATGKFPVQVLNEARAILTHLARVDMWRGQDDAIAYDNCIKAKRHIKRAQLDCYKVLCLSTHQIMAAFNEKYADIDLFLADNGQFAKTLADKRRAAEDALAIAWKAEADGTDEKAVFDAYENAYQSHAELKDFLQDDRTLEHLAFAVQMTDRNKKANRRAIWLTVVSIVLAIISILEGIALSALS